MKKERYKGMTLFQQEIEKASHTDRIGLTILGEVGEQGPSLWLFVVFGKPRQLVAANFDMVADQRSTIA